jgi:hypothetical protein
MHYVHAREKMRRGATTMINCQRICQASLLDDENYKLFQTGKIANCAVQSPPGQRHQLIIPRTDCWNIVLTYEGDIMTILEYDIRVKDIFAS